MVNSITRTSYYESFSMIGTGFMLNGILARGCPHQVRRAAREHRARGLAWARATEDVKVA